MTGALLIAGKEAGELLLSLRGLAWLLATSAVLSGFGLLLVGSSELSLLDNAQVVYDMLGTVTALGCLIAVVAGSDGIAGERERGTLVPLLLAPLRREAILFGKLGGQLVAWLAIFILALPYVWAVGSTGQNLGSSILALAVLGTPLVLGFGFFALGLSARVALARSSLLPSLILLLLSASPLLLGPSLRQSAVGRIFDAINPFSGALNAYDAMIIDSEPLGAQLSRLALPVLWMLLAAGFAWTGVRRLAP